MECSNGEVKFIGSFGAVWSNLDDKEPEAVVEYQKLEWKLQRPVSASELIDNPSLRNDYLRMRNGYDALTADKDRMSIVNDYNDRRDKVRNYLLLAGIFEIPLVWGIAGYFSKKKTE